MIEGFYYTLIRAPLAAAGWAKYLKEKGVAAFATRYLPNINEHFGSDWILEKLLCFTVQSRVYRREYQKNVRLYKSKRKGAKAASSNRSNKKRSH